MLNVIVPASWLLLLRLALAKDGRPNMLLLFPDQWRYDWDGFHTLNTGELPLHLPTVKAIANRGVRFAQAYVPSPNCAPSRSALASGREYDHTQVPSNEHDFPTNVTTFYHVLRDYGYHTMTTGKDDLTKKSQLGYYIGYPGCPQCRDGDGLYRQAELGFSDALRYSGKYDVVETAAPHEMYGFYLRNLTVNTEDGTKTDAFEAQRACIIFPNPVKHPEVNRSLCDAKTFTAEYYQDDWTASNAVTLLRRRPRDRPFFLHVAFPGPHDPFMVTAAMRAAVSDGRILPGPFDHPKNKEPFGRGGACAATGEPDSTRDRCNYAAELENLDRLFKIVIDEVDDQGELNNTLIVISSDHGEMLGDHSVPAKGKPWQGSVSVPLIIAGPGVSEGKVVESPVGTLDIVGTFLDYGGAKAVHGMTTVSMRPFLQSDSEASYRPFVSSGFKNFRMVVKEINGASYKYICCKGQCPRPPLSAPPVSKSGWMQMLIDVTADPFDMNDLSTDKPEIVAELQELLPSVGYEGVNYAAGCKTIKADGYPETEELNAEQKKATQATNASSSSATVIGQSTGVIDGSAASCRETKCAYGMLLTDELLRYGKTVNSKTQIALYNGGGIRASIPKGDVTDEHLKAVHPYGNHIILAEVPGSAIKTMVEVALKEHGAPLTGAAGNWLQRSGMRFTSSWDSTSSSWTTPVIEVAKGGDDSWELLDLDRKYGIVTNQYIMDGNGGRNVIKNAAKEVNDTQKTVLSLMTEYFQHSSPVAPPLIRMHY